VIYDSSNHGSDGVGEPFIGIVTSYHLGTNESLIVEETHPDGTHTQSGTLSRYQDLQHPHAHLQSNPKIEELLTDSLSSTNPHRIGVQTHPGAPDVHFRNPQHLESMSRELLLDSRPSPRVLIRSARPPPAIEDPSAQGVMAQTIAHEAHSSFERIAAGISTGWADETFTIPPTTDQKPWVTIPLQIGDQALSALEPIEEEPLTSLSRGCSPYGLPPELVAAPVPKSPFGRLMRPLSSVLAGWWVRVKEIPLARRERNKPKPRDEEANVGEVGEEMLRDVQRLRLHV
jgi:hypothetical protein